MNKYFSNTAVGYICVAAVVIVGLTNCSGTNKVSDEAVKAQTEACAKIGQKPYIELTSSRLLMDCRAAEPAPASSQAK